MKLILLTLLLLFSLKSFADNDATCDLIKAKADITSSILTSPYVYGSNNESNTATLAIGYSISGLRRGGIVQDVAEAKCIALASTSVLDEQQKWILLTIYKAGAKEEINSLMIAKVKAKTHIELIEQQLKTQNATLSDYNTANQILLNIEEKINQQRIIISEPIEPIDTLNIKKLVEQARFSEARVAELMAKEEAGNSWDLSVVAGTQKDLYLNGPIQPFIGVNFKWSFSNWGMGEKIAKVKAKSEQVFNESKSGYTKSIDRLMLKISELSKVEEDKRNILDISTKNTKRLITSFQGVDTYLANNNKQVLIIQLMTQLAELEGIIARQTKYTEILSIQ